MFSSAHRPTGELVRIELHYTELPEHRLTCKTQQNWLERKTERTKKLHKIKRLFERSYFTSNAVLWFSRFDFSLRSVGFCASNSSIEWRMTNAA